MRTMPARPRADACSRRKAKANRVTKRMSGRIASLAAAAIGLVGTIERTNWPIVGISPTFSVEADSADLSAAAESPGIGHRLRSRGVSRAARIELVHRTARKVRIALPARRLARAASAEAAMPVMRSETMSGTMVILSASSHRPPTGFATATASSTHPPSVAALAMPRMSPRARARRIRVACDIPDA
jgi:hypothetical protein